MNALSVQPAPGESMLESLRRALTEYKQPDRPEKWQPRIDDVLEYVDLSIAYSPVLPDDCSMPVSVQKCNGGTYIAYDYSTQYPGTTDGRHTFGIDEKTVRKWRARYLVMRDEIFRTVLEGDYRNFPELSRHSVKMNVLPAFKIHWIPSGDLTEAFKKHYRDREVYVQADGSIASF